MIAIISAATIAAGSAVISTRATLMIVKSDITYMQQDLISISKNFQTVQAHSTELVRAHEWQKATDLRISNIERTQSVLIEQTKDRYPRSEATKDYQQLLGTLKAHIEDNTRLH